MKLFITGDKDFYNKMPIIKKELEAKGHKVILPIDYENPKIEVKKSNIKRELYQQNTKIIEQVDGIIVLNFNKNNHNDHVDSLSFLQMYIAFMMNKLIYLYNPIPKSLLEEEIQCFNPIVIDRDLEKITFLNDMKIELLKFLNDNDSKSASDLAEELGLDYQECMMELDLLHKYGFIKKDSWKYCKITERGIVKLNTMIGKKL